MAVGPVTRINVKLSSVPLLLLLPLFPRGNV